MLASDPEYLLRLAERIHRLLVLACLVQGFTFGAQLFDFSHLLRAHFGLGQRRVDRFHVCGTVEGERGSAPQRERCCKKQSAYLHVILLSMAAVSRCTV